MSYTNWENTPDEARGLVEAWASHATQGTAGFGTATTPTLAEVDGFLESAYNTVSVMLTSYGYGTAQTGSAVMAVLTRAQALNAVIDVELSNPVVSTQSGEGNDRFIALKEARDDLNSLIQSDGLSHLGAAQFDSRGAFVYAGGLSRSRKRSVRDNTDLVQARFPRGWGQSPFLKDIAHLDVGGEG